MLAHKYETNGKLVLKIRLHVPTSLVNINSLFGTLLFFQCALVESFHLRIVTFLLVNLDNI